MNRLREYAQKWLYDDSSLADEERRALLIKAGLRAGWDAPEMDVYNDRDSRRQL